jgi:hypothetical protein
MVSILVITAVSLARRFINETEDDEAILLSSTMGIGNDVSMPKMQNQTPLMLLIVLLIVLAKILA